MLDQSYTANNFRRLLRPVDFSTARYSLPSDKDDLQKLLVDVEDDYLKGKIDLSSLDKVSVKGKTVFRANNFATDVILRKLTDNIKRLYKISQPDRNEIVRQLIELSSDGTPIQFIRRDIKSFYESIPRDKILENLSNDFLLSWESKKLLSELFQSPLLKNTSGLPRGIGLSAVLSEYYLRQLDKSIKNIEGIIFYARYVDDIIIVCFKNTQMIEAAISEEVKRFELTLNEKKSPPPLLLPEKAKNICSCVRSCRCNEGLEYLGYKISFPVPPPGWDKKKKGRYVSVSFSKDKIRKIKSRIMRAFVSYTEFNAFHLLEKRIGYLTSNYPLPLNKFKKNLKGGVYYNYPLINDIQIFEDLDRFLRKAIFSNSGTLGRRLKKVLTKVRRDELKKYSFKSGFERRYFMKLSSHEISDINKCWRHD